MCDNAYASSSFEVGVNSGIQQWEVTASGTFRITVRGARGGNGRGNGGYGAQMRGDFSLESGDILQILVGQHGIDGTYTPGGGGGSFVAKGTSYTNAVPLIVAGGGGGYGNSGGNGFNAVTTTGGRGGYPNYAPGTNGYGSTADSNGGWGSSGGGFYSGGNGVNSWIGSNSGQRTALAKGFRQGGRGALGSPSNPGGSCSGAGGGFGGGGDGACNGGGGGGGYSGGGSGGGGGGSFNIGQNPSNSAGVGTSHGQVTIDMIF